MSDFERDEITEDNPCWDAMRGEEERPSNPLQALADYFSGPYDDKGCRAWGDRDAKMQASVGRLQLRRTALEASFLAGMAHEREQAKALVDAAVEYTEKREQAVLDLCAKRDPLYYGYGTHYHIVKGDLTSEPLGLGKATQRAQLIQPPWELIPCKAKLTGHYIPGSSGLVGYGGR